jgi:hypothetical protein
MQFSFMKNNFSQTYEIFSNLCDILLIIKYIFLMLCVSVYHLIFICVDVIRHSFKINVIYT